MRRAGRFPLRYPIIAIPLLLLLWLTHAWMTGTFTSEYRLAALLNLDELPASTTGVSCRDDGLWDDATRCTGFASIPDMAILMSGRPFVPASPKNPVQSDAASECFPIAGDGFVHCYRYHLPELGPSGYRSFGYSEPTGRFYAASFSH